MESSPSHATISKCSSFLASYPSEGLGRIDLGVSVKSNLAVAVGLPYILSVARVNSSIFQERDSIEQWLSNLPTGNWWWKSILSHAQWEVGHRYLPALVRASKMCSSSSSCSLDSKCNRLWPAKERSTNEQ